MTDEATSAVADTATAEVTAFTSRGPNLLTFAWPSALVGGKTYMAIPSRSVDGERWYVGTGKQVAVLPA